jgi:hypothetical protein
MTSMNERNDSSNNSDNRIICEKCHSLFSSEKMLRRHIEDKHSY